MDIKKKLDCQASENLEEDTKVKKSNPRKIKYVINHNAKTSYHRD
jgi:hypothetical protein